MERHAFYEMLVGAVELLRTMGEHYEEVRSNLVPRPSPKVNRDLNNLAECIHKGRTAIIRGINTTLAKPTVKQYLGLGGRQNESTLALSAEISRLQLKLRELEAGDPTEAADGSDAAGDDFVVVPNASVKC